MTMENEQIEVPESGGKGTNWTLIYAIAAFMISNLVTAAIGWGHSSTSLDALTAQVARLEVSVNTLTDNYTRSDKSVASELARMNEHMSSQDTRIDKLEMSSERRK